MKRFFIILMAAVLCLGGIPVTAQEPVRFAVEPCWFGEVYSVDCTYIVSGGAVTDVQKMLGGGYFDWNYIAEENLLLIAFASASPLPDPSETAAFFEVSADGGTTLTLQSMILNGNPVKLTHTISGTVASHGDENAAVTVRLLQDGEVKYTAQVTGTGYSIPGVTIGVYVMQIRKAGHLPLEYTVTVQNEDIVRNAEMTLYGDLDRNGCVETADCEILKSYFRGCNVSFDTAIADVNADGILGRDDAMILSRCLAGWEGYSLPYGSTDQ